MKEREYERGSVDGWMIGAVGAAVLFIIAAALAIWMYMAFSEAKANVDTKVQLAKAEAKREQAEADQKEFDERYKNPRIEFVGPSEYGRVSFMYPKIWSVYVDKDGTDRGDYRAYLHPSTVPPVGNRASRFALRLEILNKDFDKVLKGYESLLKKGDVTSSSVEFNGNASTRLDGAFSKELRGSVVLMKVRDKTIRFSTDADTFKPDFKTVLDTVKFVQ
ncbi:MAG: hypothetical protein Q4A34_02320 [Candidatus Saccharibacteria bacterium]|nr:hypothetical protein [Candidatus Saccharibacteria bacterium]